MTRRSHSRLVPRACECLFELVLDIERYPEFVPGYTSARILRRGDRSLEVVQRIGLGPAGFSFRSRAELMPPERLCIRALDGPLRQFDVDWHFRPREDGCLVSVDIAYALSPWLSPLLQGSLSLLAPRMLEAFARRAGRLCNGPTGTGTGTGTGKGAGRDGTFFEREIGAERDEQSG